MLFDEGGERGWTWHGTQLPRHGADPLAKFRGTSGGVAMPERHLARFAGRWRNNDPIVRDLLDAPRRRSKNDGVAGAAFEHHLFIEPSDARALGGARQEYAV